MSEDRKPGLDEAHMIAATAVAGRRGTFDLMIRDGRIAELRAVPGPARQFCLPPLVDLHVHACRAFVGGAARDLSEAVVAVRAALDGYTAEDYARHAAMLYRRGLAHGTTRMRTHADVDGRVGLAAVHGSLQAPRAELDVEVVAFVTAAGDPACPDHQALLREAVVAGAELIGASLDFVPDPVRSIDALLDLATELGVGVDVHLDEHVDPARSYTRRFAEAVRERGIVRATVGHACAVAMLPGDERARTLEALLAAGIEVVALPTTNLFLQDRPGAPISRRGITCVAEMIAAGVPVRFASDNVRDPFYPLGDADLLEVAALTMTAAQIVDEAALVAGICAGRATLNPGDCADLVVIPAAGFLESLAVRPSNRVVLKAGAVIKEKTSYAR